MPDDSNNKINKQTDLKPGIPSAKAHVKWKLALCQHPMFWLIHEDSICAERSADWGGDFEHHLHRLERNLNALDQYPELKTCWDMAGQELDLIAQIRPDLVQRMRGYVEQGRISFLNGTWTQPHFQSLGNESFLKQFEYGRKTIKRLTGCDVRFWASQEAGFTEQFPQLLTALGYIGGTLSHFAWRMIFLTPHSLLGYRGRLNFMEAEPTAHWKAPNGALLPIYLADVGGPLHGGISDEGVLWEYQKYLLRAPSVRIAYPDMIEADPEWIQSQLENGEFVLLDKEVEAIFQKQCPKSIVRLIPSYTYTGEGIDGSKLNILNRRAETLSAQRSALDVLMSVALNMPAEDRHDDWETILTCQHHDGYWHGGPELRAKAEKKLHDLIARTEASIAQSLSVIGMKLETHAGGGCIVYNSIPKPRLGVAKIPLNIDVAGTIADVACDNEKIPCQIVASSEKGKEALMLLPVKFDGLGYKLYDIERRPFSEPLCMEIMQSPCEYKNPYYRVVINTDMTIEALQARDGDGELLRHTDVMPNELRAMRPDGSWLTTRGQAKSSVIQRGPVATVITSKYEFPEGNLRVDCLMYDVLPWFEFTAKFQFDSALFGDYWIDDTKLCLRLPLSFTPKTTYETQCAWIEGELNMPLIVNGWLNMTGGPGGIAYFNSGFPKHYIVNDVMVNVLAWGEKGDKFNSRCYGAMRYQKPFDLSLKGEHVFSWGIMPHPGSFLDAEAPFASRRFTEPLIGHLPVVGHGGLPSSMEIISLRNRNLMPINVGLTPSGVKLTLFENGERETEPSVRTETLNPWHLEDLSGQRRDSLNKFDIGCITFKQP